MPNTSARILLNRKTPKFEAFCSGVAVNCSGGGEISGNPATDSGQRRSSLRGRRSYFLRHCSKSLRGRSKLLRRRSSSTATPEMEIGVVEQICCTVAAICSDFAPPNRNVERIELQGSTTIAPVLERENLRIRETRRAVSVCRPAESTGKTTAEPFSSNTPGIGTAPLAEDCAIAKRRVQG